MLASLSPRQLAQILLTCSCVLAASLLMQLAPYPAPDTHGLGFAAFVWANRLLVTTSVLPVLISLTVAFLAQRTLDLGLIQARWTEQAVEQAREFLLRRVVTWILLGYLGASILVYFLMRNEGHHPAGLAFAYIAVWPTTAAQARLRRPPPSQQQSWPVKAPLHSEHWGNH